MAHSNCEFIHGATLRGESNSLKTNTQKIPPSLTPHCALQVTQPRELIIFKNQDEGQHDTQNFPFIFQ